MQYTVQHFFTFFPFLSSCLAYIWKFIANLHTKSANHKTKFTYIQTTISVTRQHIAGTIITVMIVAQPKHSNGCVHHFHWCWQCDFHFEQRECDFSVTPTCKSIFCKVAIIIINSIYLSAFSCSLGFL